MLFQRRCLVLVGCHIHLEMFLCSIISTFSLTMTIMTTLGYIFVTFSSQSVNLSVVCSWIIAVEGKQSMEKRIKLIQLTPSFTDHLNGIWLR